MYMYVLIASQIMKCWILDVDEVRKLQNPFPIRKRVELGGESLRGKVCSLVGELARKSTWLRSKAIRSTSKYRTRIALVLIYGMKERFLKNKGEITEIPGVVTPKGSGSPIIGVSILVYVIRENLMGFGDTTQGWVGMLCLKSVNIVYMLIS